MSIVVNPYSEPERWLAYLGDLLPDDELIGWPETGDPEAVEFVIAWRLPRAAMRSFINLRAVLSLAAGAEQWQAEGMPDLPVVRLDDPSMSNEMAAYALHYVIGHQRRSAELRSRQRDRIWADLPTPPAWATAVGILGYGNIGRRIGAAFADLGFPVLGWSRTERDVPGGTHFSGREELEPFLSECDAVVNVLPNTPETRHVLDASTFPAFREGSILVNIGRGTTVDEPALLAALDQGSPAAAVLDVTDPEPPESDSPLWTHPHVTLTPHVSGRTRLKTAAGLVVANIERIRAGQAPFPLLDRARGY